MSRKRRKIEIKGTETSYGVHTEAVESRNAAESKRKYVENERD